MVLKVSSMDTLDHQKMNKWVLEQIKLETLLKKKIKILKLSYFKYIRRR